MPESAVVSAAGAGNVRRAKRRPRTGADAACHRTGRGSSRGKAAAQSGTHLSAAHTAAHATTTKAATHTATHVAAAATHTTTTSATTSASAACECPACGKRECCCENCYQGEFLAHDIPTFLAKSPCA
jgi:hypothetical protein